MRLANFEVGGTITTGVRVFHLDCGEWFAEWGSRDPFPTVAELADICHDHTCPGSTVEDAHD